MTKNSDNYYNILGVDYGASNEDIHKAYVEKAKDLHPDLGGEYSGMVALNDAYNALKDETRRFWYNKEMGFDKAIAPRAKKAKIGPARYIKQLDETTSLLVKVMLLIDLIVLLTLLLAVLFNTLKIAQ
jgi:DnaJ-class molecular chaperone with C-terminal Zn finger domain